MEQSSLLRKAIEELERQQTPYFVVGSFASGAYGEPRMTRDIDIVVDLHPSQVEELCNAFPAPEFYVSLLAAREAVHRRGQFNVIHPGSGNKIDFIIARIDAWGKSQLARRQCVQILPDLAGFVASPEDVIIGKLWYYEEGGSEKRNRQRTHRPLGSAAWADVDMAGGSTASRCPLRRALRRVREVSGFATAQPR